MNIRSFRKVEVAIIGGGADGLSVAQEVSGYTDDCLLIGPGLLTGLPPSVFVDWASDWCLQWRRPSAAAPRLSRDTERGGAVRARPVDGDLRQLREQFSDALRSGSFEVSPDRLVDGEARLVGPRHVHVAGRIIEADAIIVAAGSRPIVPQKWRAFADGIVGPEALLAADSLPGSLAVIGLGPEGLALAQAMQRLGVDVSGFDTTPQLAGIRDPDVAAEALAVFDREFPIVLGRTIDVRRTDGGFCVSSGPETAIVEQLLVTQGNRSNAAGLGWQKIGVRTDERGVPLFDGSTLRIPGTSVFIVGEMADGQSDPQSLVMQGRIAGFNAVHGSLRRIPDVMPPSISFTDPNIAAVGEPLSRLNADQTVTAKLRFSATAQGSPSYTGGGVLKVYAERDSGRLLGGAMIGPGCEHIAHLLAAFVQQRLSVHQALDMPVFHPLIEETLRAGLSVLQRSLEQRPSIADDLPVIRPGPRLGAGVVVT